MEKWLEFTKDYDCEIHCHPGKANLVADTLIKMRQGWMRFYTKPKIAQQTGKTKDFTNKRLVTTKTNRESMRTKPRVQR